MGSQELNTASLDKLLRFVITLLPMQLAPKLFFSIVKIFDKTSEIS